MATTDSRTVYADVMSSSDFRLPGGTSHSVAQEVLAQSRAGYTTLLMHIESQLIRRPLPWSPPIISTLGLEGVSVMSRTRPAHTQLLILRHPSAYVDHARIPRGVTAERVVMVANHAANDADGSINYDVTAVDANLRAAFGGAPVWAPIGPVVRESLRAQNADVQILESDWLNVIELPENISPRSGFVADVPVIGRHSRPQVAKWPSRPKEIRDAYPLTNDYRVRVLGGGDAVKKVLGKIPSRWEVLPFGGEDPAQFLQSIDFWVYFHHENTREAYGRAIVEALASGAVVILPEYLSSTYGDAAIYARPADVRAIVSRFWNDPEAFRRQSARGQSFAISHSPKLHINRIAAYLPSPSRRPDANATRKGHPLTSGRKAKSALFVTSNGAGMGHLTRLLAVARRLPPSVRPAFASLSTGVPVVGKFGIPYEYIPSSGAMNIDAVPWNRYFTSRLSKTLDALDPAVLVFDGTVPYGGLLAAVQGRNIKLVWMRRGMWKREVVGRQLSKSSAFSLIIEPGDLASAYDEGVTVRLDDAVKVDPITLLSAQEMLSRSGARQELGYVMDERIALVTLGAGNINDIGDLQSRVVTWFAEHRPDWRVVVTKPPIALADEAGQAETLQTYPLAKYAKAFDVAVSAAGYNSFHEWMVGELPTLWVPNTQTLADDQVARTRWARDAAVGRLLYDVDLTNLASELEVLTDEEWQLTARANMRAAARENGASMAASLVSELLHARLGGPL